MYAPFLIYHFLVQSSARLIPVLIYHRITVKPTLSGVLIHILLILSKITPIKSLIEAHTFENPAASDGLWKLYIYICGCYSKI